MSARIKEMVRVATARLGGEREQAGRGGASSSSSLGFTCRESTAWLGGGGTSLRRQPQPQPMAPTVRTVYCNDREANTPVGKFCNNEEKDCQVLLETANTKDEVPSARPLPRFPIQRVQPQPSSSGSAGTGTAAARAEREARMRHMPEWLPAFRDSHTYVSTEVQVRQRRKAEKSLLSLQRQLAMAGADGFRPALAVAQDSAEKGKEIQVAGTV